MDKNFKKNFLKGSAAATAGTIASMVFHFFSIMLITRALTKEAFGIYALVIVVVHLFNIVSGLGLELTLVKHIAGGVESEKREVLFPVLALRTAQLVIISAVFFLLYNTILESFAAGLVDLALLIFVLFIITNYRDLFYYLLQGLNYFRNFAYTQVISAFTRVVLIGIYLLLGTLDLITLLYIEIATTALSVLLQLIYIPLSRLFFIHFKRDVFLKIIRFSFPLYLNNLLVFSSGRIQVLIIAAYLTPVSVALYDIANKVPDALKRIAQSFIVVFFPNISTLFSQGDKVKGERLMIRSLSAFSITLMFIVLISFLFGTEITLLLFSRNYIESAAAFAFLMLAFYLLFIANIMGYSLVSLGYPSVSVIANTGSTAVSIGGSILLIPYFGFMGVVYAQVAMHLVTQIIYRNYLKKAGVKTGTGEYLKPAAIAAVIYFAYLLQPLHTFPVKVLFALLYPVISWILLSEFKSLIGFMAENLKLKDRLAGSK